MGLRPSTPSSPMPTMDSQRAGEAGSGMTGSARPMNILILGGTAEARALAAALADRLAFAVTLSLAGRTAAPAPQPVPVRSGGFGGAEGLARYLRDERIEVLIDATHPYAAAISANAAQAAASRLCQAAGAAAAALDRKSTAMTGSRSTRSKDAVRGSGQQRRAACSSPSAATSFSLSPPRPSTII